MLIYANLCKWEKLMKYIFPEIGKIDKAQFILDRSGLVLKTCKIPTASLNCKMLHFFSLSFSEAAHAYSFHLKNFEILTKFSDSMAKKTFDVQSITAIQLIIIPQWQKYWFLHINERTHAMLDLSMQKPSLKLQRPSLIQCTWTMWWILWLTYLQQSDFDVV